MKKIYFLTFLLFPFYLWAVDDSISSYTNLEEVVVSAIRVSEKTPISHSNIEQKEIQSNNYGQDIPYLIQNTPSVVVTSDAGNGVGYTDIRIRGVDASRINVTTNGVPMNDAESHKMYWVDTPDLASAVNSMQIQRGAGSSTNGAGAFGGSINMTTETLKKDFGGEVSLSYGMFNTNKESIGIHSGLLGEHWILSARLSHIYSDGYIERASSDMKSFLAQAAYYKGKTTLKYLTFGGKEETYNAWDGLTKNQMEENRRYNPCGEIKDANGKVIAFYDNQVDNYFQWNNQLILNHVFNSRWNMNLVGHYTYGNGYYDQYKNDADLVCYTLPIAGDKESSNLTRKKSMYNHFFGGVGSVKYESTRTNLALGLAANHYTGEHFGEVLSVFVPNNFSLPHEYYRNAGDKTDMNFFAKATFNLFNGFDLYCDLQYRYIHHVIGGTFSSFNYATNDMLKVDVDKKYHFFNPKAGVNYTFAKYNSIFASFAVAQREPTRDDFVNARKDPDGKPLYPLPEKMFDYEIGYKLQHKYVNFGLNLYYMDYDNQLVLTGQQNMDTYDALYENVKDSYRRGVELDIAVKPLEWFSFGGNVTLSQNRIKNYDEYVYNDDTWSLDTLHLGTTTISYSPSVVAGWFLKFEVKGFEAQLISKFVSEQYITNSEQEDMKLDAYSVTDLKLGYLLKTNKIQGLRFGLSFNNLFNAKYCSNAYGYSGIYGGKRVNEVFYFPQATFNVLANVRYEF
jgi:iron complex outermembrane receptor protein